MVPAGLQVLADSEDIHIPAPEVGHGLLDLLHGVAQSHHQAGFGQDFRAELPGVDQSGPGGFVGALGLDGFEQPGNGFQVVVEDIRPGVHDDLEGFQAALEIRDEYFHGALRAKLPDPADDHGKDRRPAVAALVAVDAGDNSVLQIHGLDRLGDPLGFIPVQGAGLPVFHITELAGPGADIPQQQEGGSARAPAFTPVGAERFLADSMQGLILHQGTDFMEGPVMMEFHPQPGRQAFMFSSWGGIYSLPGRGFRHAGSLQLRGALRAAGGLEGYGRIAERAVPGGWFRCGFVVFPGLEAVDGPDQQEHGHSDEQKRDHRVDEEPVVDRHRAGSACVSKRRIRACWDAVLDYQEKIGEIHAAQYPAQRGHENIIDERFDDGRERGADDDAHRHVEHVAAQREFLEFL